MSWTATITEHCSDGLSMLVRYEREGYEPIITGVMLPPAGLDAAGLQMHLAAYAPHGVWAYEDEKRVAREAPPIGTRIEAPPPFPVLDLAPAAQPEAVLGRSEVIL